MNIAMLINELNAKGIKLWQKDSQLKFKAPKEIWTDEIREERMFHHFMYLFISFCLQIRCTIDTGQAHLSCDPVLGTKRRIELH